MKAVFELEFEDAQTAKKAGQVLAQKILGGRTALQCTANKNFVRATITAESFSPLRAISTSFLRDARVFYDSIELISKSNAANIAKETKADVKK